MLRPDFNRLAFIEVQQLWSLCCGTPGFSQPVKIVGRFDAERKWGYIAVDQCITGSYFFINFFRFFLHLENPISQFFDIS